MATVNDYKTERNYHAESLGGDDATLENLSGVSSVVVPAPLGHGVTQYFAEGDAATYSPSNEPMGVSSPQMNPTNSEPQLFNAYDEPITERQEYKINELGGKVDKSMNRSDASDYIKELQGRESGTYKAEGDAATYSPSNDPQTSSPRTEPTNSSPNLFGAESKSMFTKDKNGKMYARKRNGRIITRNAQGYDDKMDESMGERHRGTHSQSMKDRRDEASAMDKMHSKMGRKYDDVMTMDAQGYDDKMDESLGMRHRGSHSQSMKDRRDEASAMDKGHSMMGRKYDDVMTMDSEFVPNGDGRITGQQDFVYNGTPFHSESYEADYSLEKPFKTGAYLSAGLLTGAALFSVAGVAITAFIGEMLNRGE